MASTTVGTMTADELFALPDDHLLHEHVRRTEAGVVFAAETGFVLRRDPDTVRAPDAAFVTRERLEAIGDTERYWPEAPAFTAEVGVIGRHLSRG